MSLSVNYWLRFLPGGDVASTAVLATVTAGRDQVLSASQAELHGFFQNRNSRYHIRLYHNILYSTRYYALNDTIIYHTRIMVSTAAEAYQNRPLPRSACDRSRIPSACPWHHRRLFQQPNRVQATTSTLLQASTHLHPLCMKALARCTRQKLHSHSDQSFFLQKLLRRAIGACKILA